MKALFQSVVWPAVAGNVAWAFFTIAIEKWNKTGIAPVLAVLALAAVYLALDWIQTENVRNSLRSYYWIGDLFLAPAITVFAIGTQLQVQWIEWSLSAVFAIAAAGHFLGAWEPKNEPAESGRRFTLTWINALGIVPLQMNVWPFRLPPYSWHLPASVALVIGIWVVVRRNELFR